jgi:hypothetical protein
VDAVMKATNNQNGSGGGHCRNGIMLRPHSEVQEKVSRFYGCEVLDGSDEEEEVEETNEFVASNVSRKSSKKRRTGAMFYVCQHQVIRGGVGISGGGEKYGYAAALLAFLPFSVSWMFYDIVCNWTRWAAKLVGGEHQPLRLAASDQLAGEACLRAAATGGGGDGDEDEREWGGEGIGVDAPREFGTLALGGLGRSEAVESASSPRSLGGAGEGTRGEAVGVPSPPPLSDAAAAALRSRIGVPGEKTTERCVGLQTAEGYVAAVAAAEGRGAGLVMGAVEAPPMMKIYLARFHGMAHKALCRLLRSVNFRKGSGSMDGEFAERAFSVLGRVRVPAKYSSAKNYELLYTALSFELNVRRQDNGPVACLARFKKSLSSIEVAYQRALSSVRTAVSLMGKDFNFHTWYLEVCRLFIQLPKTNPELSKARELLKTINMEAARVDLDCGGCCYPSLSLTCSLYLSLLLVPSRLLSPFLVSPPPLPLPHRRYTKGDSGLP